MPDQTTRAVSDQSAAELPGPYAGRLTEEDFDAYLKASDDPDLAEEIQIMRTVLSRLTSDVPANKQTISAMFGALVRAAAFQVRQSREPEDVERALGQACDQVLSDALQPSLFEEEVESPRRPRAARLCG